MRPIRRRILMGARLGQDSVSPVGRCPIRSLDSLSRQTTIGTALGLVIAVIVIIVFQSMVPAPSRAEWHGVAGAPVASLVPAVDQQVPQTAAPADGVSPSSGPTGPAPAGTPTGPSPTGSPPTGEDGPVIETAAEPGSIEASPAPPGATPGVTGRPGGTPVPAQTAPPGPTATPRGTATPRPTATA